MKKAVTTYVETTDNALAVFINRPQFALNSAISICSKN
jgi:hypothetical protein